MDACRVSIIMPCYNDGQYIEEAVGSVMKQTFSDYELIIVDDGSDDARTKEVLASFTQPWIRLLHTNHIGPAGARNRGIREARGDYILPLDSDDIIEAGFLEKTVPVLDSDPKVGVVCCYVDLFGCASGRWDLPDYSREELLLDNCICNTSLFRREDWVKCGGYNENMQTGIEDYDFWLSVLELGREIRQIPEVLFHYRIKEKSRTTGFAKDCGQMQQAYRVIFENHRELYRDNYDLIIPALRDQLIEQTFIREKMEAGLKFLEPFHKIKFLKRFLKKFL